MAMLHRHRAALAVLIITCSSPAVVVEGGESEPSSADADAPAESDAEVLARLKACSEPAQSVEAAGDIKARAICQAKLAELYLRGVEDGLAANMTAATELLEDAAGVGNPDAQYMLAVLYSAMHQPSEDPRQREALAVLHFYAASTAGHPGALMAMGYRHMHGYGVPRACATAALNYIDVAKKITSVYSSGMPQAVELIRLNLHQKDRKVIGASEMNLFVQIASSGDTTVAAAIGKRYLLGIEGFRQDYKKARHYLRMAADRNHPGALALLGYMYCLGLGIPQNLDMAYSYFVSASAQNDALGHNGLGFIYFRGTGNQGKNLKLAFKHFNESAHGGSSDGMFNLASMYLTGTGVEQSFQRAVLYFTQALDRGHTPAAYSLAVMHLNGIGTVRDCDIAVNLLKKVCERGEWVSSKLVDAYEFGDKEPDKAALLFLKLAEAGHEVAQMNVAHLLDNGAATLLQEATAADDGSDAGKQIADESRSSSRSLAQRYYELSAEQGSASSELRLGDYAYYGWGTSAAFVERDADDGVRADAGTAADGSDLELPDSFRGDDDEPELQLQPQAVDYESSLARYRRAAEMTVTGEWMQSFVARGAFNLGFMHQFGLGVSQDLHMAKQHYHRCREVDPGGLQTPVSIVLALLGMHMFFLRLPAWRVLWQRLSVDFRVHVLFLHAVGFLTLAIMRYRFAGRRRPRSGTA